ncbi:MAG: methionyl-tRNA formyltransferase [Actinomycetota bacterium]|nr:methionyl-tRNA formyltransferase [Actinomycetota bacterium]
MKVAFAGTPEFAATILRGLLDSAHEVALVISQPDARRGRGRKTTKPPVADAALEAGILLRQPARISDANREISTQGVLVVAAYGQILRPETLYAATHGAYNVHASILPFYRGAAPIERAIMAGETHTGISIMSMDEGLDTGPVALQRQLPIPPNANGGDLTHAMAELGAKAIVEGLDLLENASLTLTPQDSLKATYATKISVEDMSIRWDGGVEKARNLVRALAPDIGARAFHADMDGPIKILRSEKSQAGAHPLVPGEISGAKEHIYVGCGDGVLEVLELQKPGSRALDAREFLRGNRLEGRFEVQ